MLIDAVAPMGVALCRVKADLFYDGSEKFMGKHTVVSLLYINEDTGSIWRYTRVKPTGLRFKPSNRSLLPYECS
jgi:hypothetical protein